MAIVFTALTAMPPGLSLSAEGKISGTPTASFSGAVQIQVSNGAATATGLMSFAIDLPGIPAPPIIRSLSFADISRVFGNQIPLAAPVVEQMFSTPTIATIPVGAITSFIDRSTPTLADGLIRYFDISNPTLATISGGSESGGYSPTIVSIQGTAGLTQVVNFAADDAFYTVSDAGISVPIYGIDRRTSLYISSNNFITFTAGSQAYSGFSETSPGAGLFYGAADRSWREVWIGNPAANSFRFHYEGGSNSGTGGSADTIAEITFFDDGVIMLVTGAFGSGGGYTAIQDGISGGAVSYTLSANTSLVFTPSGGSYTVQSGSYS